jgi:hypothetical protein
MLHAFHAPLQLLHDTNNNSNNYNIWSKETYYRSKRGLLTFNYYTILTIIAITIVILVLIDNNSSNINRQLLPRSADMLAWGYFALRFHLPFLLVILAGNRFLKVL